MKTEIIVTIQKPGLLTTVQDGGRPGFRQYGVPVGGAMDGRAMRVANWLVGNSLHTAVIEMTIQGAKIVFRGSAQIAITGADMKPRLNGNLVGMYRTANVTDGSVLTFANPAQAGCRTYLAIRGEWQVRAWLGSRSASLQVPAEISSCGRLTAGAEIVVHCPEPAEHLKSPEELRLPQDLSAPVRVLPGPEYQEVSGSVPARLLAAEFVLDSASNRMGYRLSPALGLEGQVGEMISSGVVPGTVQLTPSGQLILLMNDAQTTGGYPRLLNVISADMDRAGQLKPGDTVRFTIVQRPEAVEALETYRLEELPLLRSK